MYKYVRYAEGQSITGGTYASPNGRWGLTIGIHQGTINSPESEGPCWDYDSFEDCQRELTTAITRYEGLGQHYYIWFAYAIAPDGTRHKLTEGAPFWS
jgi:hypothetical protein